MRACKRRGCGGHVTAPEVDAHGHARFAAERACATGAGPENRYETGEERLRRDAANNGGGDGVGRD